MSATVEIVRFEVPPQCEADLLAGHADTRRAIRALSPPGSLWSRLARLGGRGWLEVVAWGSRAIFERAFERAPDDPTARAWFDLAEPGWTILTGEIASTDPAPPPREGELELVWGAGAPGEAKPARDGGKGGWSTRIEIEARAWVDPSGWEEREPAALLITAGDRLGKPAAPGSDPGRERARIAHAVDPAEERAPAR